MSSWPFGDLQRRHYRVILVDAPTKFSCRAEPQS